MSAIPQSSAEPNDSGEFELAPGMPLTELVKRRRKNGQDLVILISDYHNRRGTGKTTLTLKLGAALDQTEDGFTKDKVAIQAEPILDAYTGQPNQSALGLDEAEVGVSKYDAGTAVNRTVREIVSMGRVEEKYLLLNMPASAELDRDLKALCDVWILVQSLGQALVHFLPYQPYEGKVLTKKVQRLEWDPIPNTHQTWRTYQHLTEKKKQHLRDGGTEEFIPKSKMWDIVDDQVDDALEAQRNQWLAKQYEQFDKSYDKIAAAMPDEIEVGDYEHDFRVSGERVRQIVNEVQTT